jgi:radical SAM protein with 4Fe4S-binding SPASM domain
MPEMRKSLNDKRKVDFEQLQSQTYDLSWVDEFVRKIRPYVYVRELDRLLILIPNQTYRLNESGMKMLVFLLKGRKIENFLQLVGDDDERRRDIHYFFCDLRAIISGCLHENEERRAIDYCEFNGGFNQYPVLSEIAVTYRCNLNCEFCYVGDRSYNELSTNDMKKVLFKIWHEARVPSVSFTGGEPLLRQDIVTLVSYASKLGLWTNLITNGTLLDGDCVRALKRAGLSSVQVSIEGPNREIHDAITGVQGSFASAIKGIRSLQNAGIPVHTNTTISRHNLKHAQGIILLAKKLGLSRLSMNLLIPCGTAMGKKDIWVSYSEIGDHVLELKHTAEKQGIRFLWYSPLPMCKFNPIAYGLGNKSCAAINGLLSIDPMGNIIPCSSWRRPVGSLLSHAFSDLWQSPVLNVYKDVEYAPAECRDCAEFDKCKGACPLYWQACGKSEIGEGA